MKSGVRERLIIDMTGIVKLMFIKKSVGITIVQYLDFCIFYFANKLSRVILKFPGVLKVFNVQISP